MTEKEGAVSEILMKAVTEQLDRLDNLVERLTSRRRRDLIVQWVLIILVLVLGSLMWKQFDQNHALRADDARLSAQNAQLRIDERKQALAAYQGCLAGNEFRNGNSQLWDDFITLALANNPDPSAARKLIAPFEKQIMKIDAPRDCAPLKPH